MTEEENKQPEATDWTIFIDGTFNAKIDYTTYTQKERNESMMGAIYSSNLKNLRAWVKAGADVDAVLDHKVRPLMMAAKYSSNAIVKFLVKKVHDVNAVNRYNSTALHYLLKPNERFRIVNPSATSNLLTLINAGADVNILDEDGKSPMDLLKQVIATNGGAEIEKKAIIEILTNSGGK